MKDTILTESSAIIVNDFVAKRYAQMYADLFVKKGHAVAEAWALPKIAKEQRSIFKEYILKELKKRGFKV